MPSLIDRPHGRNATISSSRLFDSGLIVALLKSNWIFSLIAILLSRTSTRGGGASSLGGGGGGSEPTIDIDAAPRKMVTPPQPKGTRSSAEASTGYQGTFIDISFTLMGRPNEPSRCPARHCRRYFLCFF